MFNNLKKEGSFLQKVGMFSQKTVSQRDSEPNLSYSRTSISSENKNLNIPDFITVSKIVIDEVEIQSGIIKDKTAKGGIRYVVIEPTLSQNQKRIFEIIRKLLMIELSISLNSIKTKKDAEQRLKRKIVKLVKKYRLKISSKDLSKIIYFAIRNFVYLGKIEPLMRDHSPPVAGVGASLHPPTDLV